MKKYPIKFALLFLAGFTLYIFVCLNIVASQSVPALYFDFVAEKRPAVVKTLFQIQQLPVYPEILRMQRDIYGPVLDADIVKENKARSANIQTLESLLQSNPNSRDVLYGLSILYKESGQTAKSTSYLEKAKQIDPSLR